MAMETPTCPKTTAGMAIARNTNRIRMVFIKLLLPKILRCPDVLAGSGCGD
jgi:hypothetical protein